MTGGRWLEEPAQRAVQFALESRTPGGAWGLLPPDDEEIDIETTAWMSLLLKSAAMSELDVDRTAFPEILSALDRVTNPSTGRVQPTRRTSAPLTEYAATAIGFTVRVLLGTTAEGRRSETSTDWLLAHPLAAKGADWLLARAPTADTADLAYVDFGSIGMISLGGDRFRAWLPALSAIVARPSVADGPDEGTWDPPGGGGEVERIWTTAYHLRFCAFYDGPVGHASMRK